LLDTHVFLWACDNPAKLSAQARDAIASDTNQVLVSAASAWEIAIKRASGKIDFMIDRWAEMLANLGFDPLPITPAHALEAGALPRHHGDPFDRVLVAQARMEGVYLVTSDQMLNQYDVRIFGATMN
jgi:PIN domain nuclease of toxin-antitoxin system